MSSRELPARPNLEHLKNQARVLLRQAQASDRSAIDRFAAINVPSGEPKYSDALHVIAREYGFDTWPKLKLSVDVAADDPEKALTAAIRAGNAGLVRDVLTRHPSLKAHINEPRPGLSFDSPAIIAAAHQENREMVDALLEAGANINERTRWWAGSFGVLDSGSPAFADFLIGRGATVDIHAASRLGRIDQVRELLRLHPDLVHARGGDGQLPLHFAATVEIASLLLDSGAAIDARDIDHESTAAQYMACIREHREGKDLYRHDVARFLVSRGAQTDILMAAALGDLPLLESVLNHDPETVRVTASERYFPKQDPNSGGIIYIFGFGITKSPHIIAHEFGHRPAFELLMQRSPAWLRLLNAAEVHDEPLFRHTIAAHPQLFGKLSDNAARRIIGVAVRNNTRALELLIGAGWPANAISSKNQNALHYAAWHGNLASVQMLLEHKAAFDLVESEHGGTCLDWALHGSLNSWLRNQGDYPAVVRALIAAGAKVPVSDGPLVASDDVLEVLQGQTS
jgi:ankyrin repeat protein